MKNLLCAEIFSGISPKYYGYQKQIEYNLIVSPRALPLGVRSSWSSGDGGRFQSTG